MKSNILKKLKRHIENIFTKFQLMIKSERLKNLKKRKRKFTLYISDFGSLNVLAFLTICSKSCSNSSRLEYLAS